MSTKTRVLMVDDEPNILSGYRRSIGRTCDLVTANSGLEGLKLLADQEPFEIVFTDMRMPEMDGVEFLKRARIKHPNIVYAMLTGNADQQTAINAINHGKIFRFLNKPCDAEVLEETIRACKAQYDLIHAESVLLNKTLSGTVKLLVEALVLTDPAAAEAVRAVREGVSVVCKGLGIQNEWSIPLASSLFMIGAITLPKASNEVVYSEQYIASCAQSGSKLLRHISRLELVSQIILNQRVSKDLPKDLASLTDKTRVVIGSQILRFSYDWYNESHCCGGDRQQGLQRLAAITGAHDDRLFTAANMRPGGADRNQATQQTRTLIDCKTQELCVGMLTETHISSSDGSLLVSKGEELSQLLIDRIQGFYNSGLIADKVSVWIEDSAKQAVEI